MCTEGVSTPGERSLAEEAGKQLLARFKVSSSEEGICQVILIV